MTLPQATAFNDAIAAGSGMDFVEAGDRAEDVAFIQYTGGTTGVAKGAVLTHRNLIANTLQVEAWQQPMLAREPQVEHLRIVAALPLYHIFALTVCYSRGHPHGLGQPADSKPARPAEPDQGAAQLQGELIPGVNTLYNALLQPSGFRPGRLEHAEMLDRRRHGGAARRWPSTG